MILLFLKTVMSLWIDLFVSVPMFISWLLFDTVLRIYLKPDLPDTVNINPLV